MGAPVPLPVSCDDFLSTARMCEWMSAASTVSHSLVRESALTRCALRTQVAIHRRGAHGEQLASTLLGQVEMLMPLQGFDKVGKKRDESFGTDAVGDMPDQEQSVLDLRSILARALVCRRVQHILGMVEQPHHIATMTTRSLSKVSSCAPFWANVAP
jgi:hypothetical protein